MPEKPNILYLHSHDIGRCIEPYGYPVATPNLMRLAETGVTLRQCFCANPTCSPSRAALLTGRYPHANGMTGLAHRRFALNDPSQHLAHFLRDQVGYHTALCGVQHELILNRSVEEIGYQTHITPEDNPERPDDHYAPIARGAANWLRSAPGEPFFLAVGLPKPHLYKGAPKDARWVSPPAGLPDAPATREHAAVTHAGIEAMDRAMGEVLDALEAQGLAGNTLVVCTTDHGLAFPERKCTLGDGGLGVMSIWRGPGGCAGGRISDALASHVDFFPTICEIAGIAPPDWLQGVSLAPVLRGERDSVRDAIHGQINYHAAYQPERCVRTERWKYIRRFDHRNRRPLANCDDSPSKDHLLAHGWAEQDRPAEELFDLALDPGEKRNLADDPSHAPTLETMRGRLERWMRDLADPLLEHGFIEPPPHARVNDVNSPSPQDWAWQRIERGS